jgi:SAM-dependent methyltransferase
MIPIVKTADLPHVYCLVRGRKRLILENRWFIEEDIPFSSVQNNFPKDELARIPLGPFCPFSAEVARNSEKQTVHSPWLMRNYLGGLARGEGVEFGPGNRPLPVRLDAQVTFIDKFHPAQPNCTRDDDFEFMPIDIVDQIESMSTVPDESQDFIIASHVIEHTPNPIGAMINANRTLRPSGKLILIVPDKERTFDRVRSATDISHLLDDHRQQDHGRDLEHYVEHYREVVKASDWPGAAITAWQAGEDIHYHCFTQKSFAAFIQVCLAFTEWTKIELIYPKHIASDTLEFYAILQK